MVDKNRLGIARVKRSRVGGPGTYYGEALHFYDEVIRIDLDKLSYVFRRGAQAPSVYHDGEDISNLSMLYILGSIDSASAQRIMLLARSMMQMECPVSDPLERLTRQSLGKLYETLRGQGTETGIDSYVANSIGSLEQALDHGWQGAFVVKPVAGSQGRGIKKFDSRENLLDYARQYFERPRKDRPPRPLYIERFIEFANEWRVYLVDGEFVCSYGKIRPENSFIANLHQGGGIVKTEPPDEHDLRAFVSKLTFDDLRTGIYGLDIGRGTDGNFYFIEANRGPGWKRVQETTGVNFPYEANRILFKRARKFK